MTNPDPAAAQQPDEEKSPSTSKLSRRRFLGGMTLAAGAGGALWMGTGGSSVLKIIGSALRREHHVDNPPSTAKPVQTRSFANSETVRCLVVGDWGTGDSFQRHVADAMSHVADREHPQFILSTGDNFYPGGVESVDDKQFRTKWKDMYRAASLQLPWYLTLGNHDYRKSADAQIGYSAKDPMWNMPSRYFSFVRREGGVSCEFFVLDTETLLHGNKDDIRTQCAWLESALQKSTAQWKVAMGHHMIRSHGAYGDQGFMLSLVKPLLDKYGVHAYLNGHDHDLQYLKAQEDSFICLISGAGGGSRNTSYGKNTRFAATNGGFVYLAFSEHDLHLEFYDAKGEAIYAEDAVHRA